MSIFISNNHMKYFGLIPAFVSISLLLTACSSKKQGGFTPPPTPVEIADVKQTDVVDKFEVVGTLEAAEAITVVSEINAAVISLPFTEGQGIEKGGLIAQLDDSQARAEVESAEASRDQAKITFDRMKQIVEADAAAKQDLDDATAALKIAQARLDQANVMLRKTRIVAPFSGILGTRRISPGAYLRAGDAITTLTQISHLKVKISVPERILPDLSVGSPVTLSSPAFPGNRLNGIISVIDPVVNAVTRGVQVIARVENTDRRLRPGMSADVSIVLGSRPNALTVPDEAVFAEGNQDFVYVVNSDGTVTRTAVTLGSRQVGTVEITNGLSAGQQIVKAGHQKLYDGAKVNPVQSGKQGAAGSQMPSDTTQKDSISG